MRESYYSPVPLLVLMQFARIHHSKIQQSIRAKSVSGVSITFCGVAVTHMVASESLEGVY